MTAPLPDKAPLREPFFAGLTPDMIQPLPRRPLHVVLDNIRSAFNTGSIFRTSDAGAVEKLWLCGMTAQPPHPRLLRTALGATDYVPWEYRPDTVEVIHILREAAIPVIAVETTPSAVNYLDFEWPQPVALVFGHEVRGIQPQVLSLCDAAVCIPMAGHKNSINVATAFGIVLFERLRRCRP